MLKLTKLTLPLLGGLFSKILKGCLDSVHPVVFFKHVFHKGA
jgi:hypothetical protein